VTLWQQQQATTSGGHTDGTTDRASWQWAPLWTARNAAPHMRAAAGAACRKPAATCAAGEATVTLYLPTETTAAVTRVALNQLAPVCSLSWRPESTFITRAPTFHHARSNLPNPKAIFGFRCSCVRMVILRASGRAVDTSQPASLRSSPEGRIFVVADD
jgi:hypothetical protein